jgi:hypothetical protein
MTFGERVMVGLISITLPRGTIYGTKLPLVYTYPASTILEPFASVAGACSGLNTPRQSVYLILHYISETENLMH